MMVTLGDRIKKLLEEKKMTQKLLAEKSGCTEAAISHYIKGDRIPRSNILKELAAALEVSADFLMEGIPQETKSEIGYAKKLIARNAEHMSKKEKLEIIDLLMGDKND